ncbi:MAG: hypothetical protein GF333_02565 [Candidatus Omnitrophica bacterium]|nr:hypothetical protein [Candidatus Omnitrophota bacterium]
MTESTKWYFRLLKGVFVILLVCVLFLVLYFPHYTKYRKLRRANQQLSREISRLKKEINVLSRTVSTTDHRSFLLEKIAREQLGVAKENEVVIDIRP